MYVKIKQLTNKYPLLEEFIKQTSQHSGRVRLRKLKQKCDSILEAALSQPYEERQPVLFSPFHTLIVIKPFYLSY